MNIPKHAIKTQTNMHTMCISSLGRIGCNDPHAVVGIVALSSALLSVRVPHVVAVLLVKLQASASTQSPNPPFTLSTLMIFKNSDFQKMRDSCRVRPTPWRVMDAAAGIATPSERGHTAVSHHASSGVFQPKYPATDACREETTPWRAAYEQTCTGTAEPPEHQLL